MLTFFSLLFPFWENVSTTNVSTFTVIYVDQNRVSVTVSQTFTIVLSNYSDGNQPNTSPAWSFSDSTIPISHLRNFYLWNDQSLSGIYDLEL